MSHSPDGSTHTDRDDRLYAAAGSLAVHPPGELADSGTDVDHIMHQDIPPEMAVQLMQLISEFKRSGQIPPHVSDRQLMHSMHADMVREKSAMTQMACRAGSQSAAGTLTPVLPLPAHDVPLPTLGLPVPSAGIGPQLSTIASIPMSPNVTSQGLRIMMPPSSGSLPMPLGNQSHDATRLSELQTAEENLIQEVSRTIRDNPSSINNQDEEGDTLLHRVCGAGMEAMVEILLRSGARPNIINHKKQSVIHLSAKCAQPLMIQLLIDYGADVAACDGNGWSALHHAASSPSPLAPQTLHYLAECCGLSYATRTNSGQSLLHIIAGIEKENNRQILPLLLSKPELDVSWVDNTGSNAVHYAAEHCQTNMCYKLVCSKGSKVLLTNNKEGKTPVDIARTLHKLQGFVMSQDMESWVKKGPNYKPSLSYPAQYYRHLYLPATILVACIILSRILTPECQGFLSTAGLFLFLFLVFRTEARINHISRLPDPSKLGGFVTGVLLFTAALLGEFAFIDGKEFLSYSRLFTLIIIYLCIVVGVVILAKLVFGDPGFTHESKRKDTGGFYTMKDLIGLRKPGVWCPVCQLIPTKPSKHCKQCERCVYWLDHHCLYTMRCIGRGNHHIFIWFNMLVVTGQILTLSLLPGYVEYVGYTQAKTDLPPSVLYMYTLMHIFMNNGLVFVVLVGTTLFLGTTASLLCSSLNNISNGYTTYFTPPDNQGLYVSGLTSKQRLSNIFNFVRHGQIQIKDPNFVI